MQNLSVLFNRLEKKEINFITMGWMGSCGGIKVYEIGLYL